MVSDTGGHVMSCMLLCNDYKDAQWCYLGTSWKGQCYMREEYKRCLCCLSCS